MWSSCYRAKAAAVSRADHPSPGDQDVGSSIAAAFTRPHYSSSTPSGTLGDATTRWPAAYPPIAAVSGGCRRRQRWANCGLMYRANEVCPCAEIARDVTASAQASAACSRWNINSAASRHAVAKIVSHVDIGVLQPSTLIGLKSVPGPFFRGLPETGCGRNVRS